MLKLIWGSGPWELFLQAVIIACGVVLVSIAGCYAPWVFAWVEINWKKELKEKCGANVGGYKQVRNKGQVLEYSW